MNIKVGQWVRTDKGHISKVVAIPKVGKGIMKHIEFKLESGIPIVYADKFTAVADTPQELVQVGDLVKIDGEIMKVPFVEKVGESEFIFNRLYRDITAIYTPDANGDFIKQWEDKQ